MSASDAAPLPRLGEVFFDVRGNSRTMRLSWYADTGVAVFSIWQGGMCTGTFRLPIGDLPRMIEILQRGPHGGAPLGGDEQDWAMAQAGHAGQEAGYTGQREFQPGGSPRRARASRHREQARPGYGDELAETAAVGFSRDELAPDLRRPDYGRDELPAEHRRPGYGRGEPGDPRRPGYDPEGPLGGPRRPGYGRDDLTESRREAGFLPEDPAGPPPSSYGWDAFSDGPYPGYQAQSAPHPGGAQQGWADSAEVAEGYGQERFVPPYVRPAGGEYPHDIPARGTDIPVGDPRGAYRGQPGSGRSGGPDYPDPSREPGGYSDDARYRLPGPPAEPPDHWTDQRSSGRHGGAGAAEPEPGRYSGGQRSADDIDGETRDFRARPAR